MATFSAVNTDIPASEDGQTAQMQPPTTPKPADLAMADQPARDVDATESSPNTPTRHSFAGVPGQRPLPDEPLTPAQPQEQAGESEVSVQRDGSHRSSKSQRKSQDVEMGEDEDGEDEGSDNESVTSESQRPSKKKKGQRFFCTDFPPCQLSFTRSEHLARHIRKHTGERPFQCHCSRRFSRLDNLRQHAQTVHVNEEIPGDSLAATSTRFQRQIRTDRVRPPTNRSRASTLGSSGGHSRGHSRNLSTSSIGSTTSSIGTPDDLRRRPQPLAMANDPSARARLSLEMAGSPNQQQYMYYNQSPTGYSTPTSTAFSTGGQSPHFSGMASPSSTISRSSFYNGARAPGRRLSVPSGQNPYQNANATYPPAYFSPLPSSQSGQFSQNSSVFASPTSSVFSHGRRESMDEMEIRRRTWHPSTNSQYAQRPATSGLTYHQTPDEPKPAFTQQQAASQMTRLPGIESFDHAPPPGVRQQPSPMMVDASPRPPSSGRPSDAGLQQGLTRLDITAANAPMDGQWQTAQGMPVQQPVYFNPQAPNQQPQFVQPKHMSMPEQPVTPRKHKRNAWYGGPITPSNNNQATYGAHRPSPEDSGSSDGVPTPSTSQGNEYNPVIINPSGMVEYPPGTALTADEQKGYYTPGHQGRTDSGYQPYGQNQGPYALQAGHDPRFAQANYQQSPNPDMAKLEALVAVATSEGSRAMEHPS